MNNRIAGIGECMLELSGATHDRMTLSYGGDTLNTAIYLARLGQSVDYLTALGDDPYSDWMLDEWRAEGVGTDFVMRVPSRLPGFYAIRTDANGERQFHYWRDQAPARELFTLPDAGRLLDSLARYNLIYLSGISLSLYDDAGRQKLRDALATAKAAGALIAFDSNYRPRGWPDAATARTVMEDFLRLTDIALPTLDDDMQIFGVENAAACAAYLHGLGVGEVAVKMGEQGCMLSVSGQRDVIETTPQGKPVDTTGAGDSFNAAYLAQRVDGKAPGIAAISAHRLAGAVIMHRGAVIPRTEMPEGERR